MIEEAFDEGDNIICYARYSGGETQKNLDVSVKQQTDAVKKYCREHLLVYFKEYTDSGISGTSTERRDGFQQMMSDLALPEIRKKVSGVIVWSYSRFARNLDDASYYKSMIRRMGYKIYSLQEPTDNTNIGRVIEFLNDWQNAEYSAKVSADVKRALKSDWEAFGVIGGLPPFGFRRVPVELPPKKDGTPRIRHRWEPDPEWMEIIRRAFMMKINGYGNKDILEELHCYKGLQSVVDMFMRPIYCGEMTFAGVTKEDYCTPIVTREVWEQAHEAQMKTNKAGRENRYIIDSPINGLVICGRCGSKMRLMRRTVKGRYYYEHFVCYGCREVDQIQREVVESAVNDFIEELLSDKSIKDKVADAIRSGKRITERKARQQDEIKKKIANIDKKIANIIDAIADYGMTDAMKEKLDELNAKKETLLLDVEEKPSVDFDSAGYYLEKVSVLIREKLDDGSVPVQEKRLLISCLIKKVVVIDKHNLKICYHLPIDLPKNLLGKVDSLEVCPQRDVDLIINLRWKHLVI